MGRVRVRLVFPPALIQEPVLYRLVKDFDIVINVRRADVRPDCGWIVLEMDADDAALERAIAWLRARGVQVDPVERDVVVP